MFIGGVFALLLPGGIRFQGIGTIRGPWVLLLSVLFIAVGVGLLKLLQWARLATVAIAMLRIGLVVVGFMSGSRRFDAMLMFTWLIGVPRDGLIVWYLLTPRIERLFARPDEMTSVSGGTN